MQSHYRVSPEREPAKANAPEASTPGAHHRSSGWIAAATTDYFWLSWMMTFLPFSYVITFWLVQCPGTYR